MRDLPTRRRISLLAAGLWLACAACHPGQRPASAPAADTVRILAYNIHHAEGMDSVLDLARLADLIRGVRPDLVAVQEVDSLVERTGRVDQTAALGELTGMNATFGSFMPYQGGAYGMAVLSRWPIERSENFRLPDGDEPRTALGVIVELPRTRVRLRFVGVHLYRTEEERLAQARSLEEQLGPDSLPTVLAGDFNSEPGTAVMRHMSRQWRIVDKGEDAFTFPSYSPEREIDYVLLRPSDRFEVLSEAVLDEPVASDHRPVLVKLVVTAQRGGHPTRRTGAAADPDSEAWTDLFDVETLDGWTVKLHGHQVGDNYANTFRAGNDLIEVRYDGYDEFDDRFGHLYYDRPFSHYRLAFEYRFVGGFMPDAPDYARLNSGVMFHSQDPRTMPVGQDWPISVEFQLLAEEEPGQPRPTGNMCSPGTEVVYDGRLDERHCIESDAGTYPAGPWVSAELLVLGDSLVRHFIEGRPVMEYTHPRIGGAVVTGYDPAQKVDGTPLTEGYIALQAEGQEVDFRNIRLLNLKGCTDPGALNFKSYYVASEPGACRF